MPKHKVHIRSVKSDHDITRAVEEIFRSCGGREKIKKDATVVVKLNLSSIEKERIAASNTHPRIIPALSGVLRDLGARILLVEADGLRYTAKYAFELNGTYELARRFGAATFNLSKDEMVYNCHPLLEGSGLPKTVLAADCLITLPVLKTHALTVISGALKNQWGCVPRYDRILLHKYLDELIAELNALFK